MLNETAPVLGADRLRQLINEYYTRGMGSTATNVNNGANASAWAQQQLDKENADIQARYNAQYQRDLEARNFAEQQRQFNVGTNLAQNRLATGLQAVSQPNPFLMGNQGQGMSSYFGQPSWSGGNAPTRQYGYAAPDKPNNLLSMGGFSGDNDFSTQVKNYLSRLMGV